MSTRAHTVPRFYLRQFVAPESDADPDPFLWVGSIETGEVKRRSPKNLSISRGLYDGPGGFEEIGKSIEAHLSRIEAAAATALRQFVSLAPGERGNPPAEIWRFLAWQAARTPGWLRLVQDFANEDWGAAQPLEPPPAGFESIKDRVRPSCVEHPLTGERREISSLEELASWRQRGWKWVLRADDHLEMMHLQAWYFQVRHFPRLSWVTLDTPQDQWFIASDRGVTWMADGIADAPPSALRHPTAELVAPLTRTTALVGRNNSHGLQTTPQEINRFIACTASSWIAGPTRAVVDQALQDRAAVSLN